MDLLMDVATNPHYKEPKRMKTKLKELSTKAALTNPENARIGKILRTFLEAKVSLEAMKLLMFIAERKFATEKLPSVEEMIEKFNVKQTKNLYSWILELAKEGWIRGTPEKYKFFFEEIRENRLLKIVREKETSSKGIREMLIIFYKFRSKAGIKMPANSSDFNLLKLLCNRYPALEVESFIQTYFQKGQFKEQVNKTVRGFYNWVETIKAAQRL